MKRTERIGGIIEILSNSPNKLFSLQYFCQLFNAAKSTLSEDLNIANSALAHTGTGCIKTISGARGGVKFIPDISDEQLLQVQEELCSRLKDKSRILGGGFLYTSDIMFDTDLVKGLARILSKKFIDCDANYVATVETKGIALATMVAHLLNLPLVVIRREAKVSEGSTVSINYFSGSYDRVQKMSIAKRAVVPGSKAIIVDDFMRAGGSIKGISDILAEFDVSIVGTGVAIASDVPEKKKIDDYTAIIYLGKVDEESKNIQVYPNCQIF